ncbi:MAG: SRPBCC family protein [Acidobacteriota bacterium]
MKSRNVVHATTVVEHLYGAPPETIFDAFADAAKRRQWDLPGDDGWELADLQQDFRVGGRLSSRFGPKGDARHWDEGTYLDIEPNVRIVSAGTMHDGEIRATLTLCTVEFQKEGGGTRVRLTDQSAFLDGRESPDDRKTGWGEILDRLENYLRSNPGAR